MRILIPQVSIPDSFVDNVQMTLATMGHTVQTLGSQSPAQSHSYLGRVAAVLSDALLHDIERKQRRQLLSIARTFRPDLILGMTCSLSGDTLRRVKAVASSRAVLWWGDTAANSRRWGLIEPEWDYVFVKDRTVSTKLGIVRRDVFHLPEAMNPAWHRPLAKVRNRRVAFVGNSYAFRQALIVRLDASGYEVELHGPPPPRWAHSRARAVHSGHYVVREEKSRIFGEAAACVNTFALSEADSLNCRAFEIAGAGGLQILEYRHCVEEYFEPGRELLTFRTWDELRTHLDRALARDPDLDTIRLAGMKRAHAEHTYERRLRSLLDVVCGHQR